LGEKEKKRKREVESKVITLKWSYVQASFQ
jgi:hypothetical protein